MSEKRQPQEFILADNEQIVRSYACTRFHRILAPATTGFLTVTDRRVVYHCQKKSLIGLSTIVAEMPIDDVGGISSAVSVSLNILFVALFTWLLYMITRFAFLFFPPILTSWGVIVLLGLPYLVGLTFVKGIINQDIVEQIDTRLDQTSVGQFLKRKQLAFYMRVFYALFMVAALLFAGKLAFSQGIGVQYSLFSRLLLIAACIWIFRNAVTRFLAFTLQITSKSSHASGIVIPGNGLMGLLSTNSAQIQSLWASPAEDAQLVVKELGAVLTDIRMMGQLGIEKWRSESDIANS